MTDKLEMSLEQFAEAVAKENARLTEEIERLTKKCDMQAMILHGTLGDKDQNGMPEKLLVVPAFGVDFSYIYERTGKTTGPEW